MIASAVALLSLAGISFLMIFLEARRAHTQEIIDVGTAAHPG
jgi:hypothetical protein